MAEDDGCGALREMLVKRCPGVRFKVEDIKNLVDAGYGSELALAAADKASLGSVLPLRPGLVGLLVKTFVRPAEVEPYSKRLKVSPAEHQPLDLEFAAAEASRYVGKLLATPPELPKSVIELQEFLSQRTEKLPVQTGDLFSLVQQPQLVKIASPVEQKVALRVESSLRKSMSHPHSEADSSHILRTISGDFLCELNSLAPEEQQLVDLEGTSGSSGAPYSTAALSGLQPLKRPDYSLFLLSALVLRWENKMDPAERSLAMEENTSKLRVWNPLFYGDLPYVIGGCCGGMSFQWLKLSPVDKGIVSEPISKLYDLKRLSGVASFLHSVVQMHRLLQRLQQYLPTNVPIRLYKEIHRRDGTVILGPEYVVKTVSQMDKDRAEFLSSMYMSITGSKYLIQLKDKIRTTRRSSVLQLHPVGCPHARPGDLKQLGNATHDMLHGLLALHNAGCTHRDLRWENCIRVNVESEWKWVIIDLEAAGPDKEEWEGDGFVNWDAGTLEDCNGKKIYTKGSDVYQLGKLIVEWLDTSGRGSRGGKEEQEMRALGEKMQQERRAAAKILEDMCKNGCQRCAKFDSLRVSDAFQY